MSFINIKNVIDERGQLNFIQENQIPFNIKRIFYITKISGMRGGHSHYECEQILICLNGTCELYHTDGNNENRFYLSNNSKGFYTPVNNWVEINNFSDNCIILVLCSHLFEEKDYCRDKDLFYKIMKTKEKNIVKFNDISKENQQFKDEMILSVKNIIERGDFTYGKETIEFEKKFSNYIGMNYCVSCSNGTSALILALQSLCLDENSEILIQSNTYVSGVIAILKNNLKIKWVDINSKNLNIDVKSLEENITENTKGLLLVHMYGSCTDMDKIMEIKRKYNLFLVEDCAQAHGSEWKNKKLGSFGDISCFSFYPTKNLGAIGEAGCILTNEKIIYERIEKLKNFGQGERYKYSIFGENYKSSNLVMSSLNIKLKKLDQLNDNRINASKIYKKHLNNKIKFLEYDTVNLKYNFHLFVVILEKRDDLIRFLKTKNIEVGIHYPFPVYKTEAYKNFPCKYDTSEIMSKKILSLPFYPKIDEKNILYICEQINNFYKTI